MKSEESEESEKSEECPSTRAQGPKSENVKKVKWEKGRVGEGEKG